MAQSADRMVQRILASVGPNTYVVLTSDNGFHLGQNGLGRGKGTPYDTDVRVPLLVVGPGVVPGSAPGGDQQHRPRPDLRGARRARARALPLRGVAASRAWRTRRWCGSHYVFLEHTQQTLTGADPDAAFSGSELDRIPSYVAVRSRDALLLARLDLDPRPGKRHVGLGVLQLQPRQLREDATSTPTRSDARRGRGADARSCGRSTAASDGRRPAGLGGAAAIVRQVAPAATRLSLRAAGRDRGRPPRLLHVEPGAPGRRGHRRAAARWCSTTRSTRRRCSRHSHVVLSPGPGHPVDPADFAVGREVLRAGTRPVLGVCLGMQGLVTAYGGTVERLPPGARRGGAGPARRARASSPGCRRASPPCATTRSAAVALPDDAGRDARGREDGVVMGVRHVSLPLEGVQFHPESVLSEHGDAAGRATSWPRSTTVSRRPGRVLPRGRRRGTRAASGSTAAAPASGRAGAR